MKDLLLDDNDDMMIAGGDFSAGESYTQEVARILKLNQGDLKSDPLLGCNLVQLINSKVSEQDLQTAVKINLARDDKDYDDVKNIMQINRNTNG